MKNHKPPVPDAALASGKKPKAQQKKPFWHALDPFLHREAERYIEPMPSREYILQVLQQAGAALSLEDLLILFEFQDERSQDGLRRRLRAMEREDQVVVTETGAYRPFLPEQDQLRVPRSAVLDVPQVQINLDIAVNLAVQEHHLPDVWPKRLLEEIKNLALTIPDQEVVRRRDLRNLALVTIDGEDARDFDDAVYCERSAEGGHRLVVAIADVSYYVRPKTALDYEAENRGTSVYFPSKVIPMLPEVLSNELCSLKPKVDRLCLVADMLLDQSGNLQTFEFYEAVMCSQARFTYNQVATVLAQPERRHEPEFKEFEAVWPHIFDLYDLFKILYQSRELRGALDFDSVEGSLILNEAGELREIKAIERNDAHKLIEEAMLCANVAAARLLKEAGTPGVYRVHEGLRAEKYPDLRDFFSSRGLKLNKQIPDAKELNCALHEASSRPDYSMIQTAVLRSMTQAIYSTDNIGHYGLAYPAYTHFTSPIRRYPDLLVHRLIRAQLAAKAVKNSINKDPAAKAYEAEDLEALCIHSSHAERRADDASRQVVMCLKCGLLQKHLGAEFNGVISGVTHFGLFVTITEWLVDGLIHVTSLPSDYYSFDPVHHRLVGERSGRSFQIGQSVSIKVVKVDPLTRKVDFLLAGYEAPQKARKKFGKRSRRS